MKNALTYYYNLTPTELHQINKTYKFKIGNANYIMYPYYRTNEELDQIYSLHLSILNSGYYCHQIILNNNKNILTIINDIPYILMLIFIEYRKININDVIAINNIYVEEKNFLKLKRNEWYNLWISKVDYIEYQISQFRKKYPLIRESCDYFIGIVENCISMLSNLKKNTTIKTICHHRINKDTTTYDLYNPINFIIDSRVRDIGEYFKITILEDKNITYKVKEYLTYNNLTLEEIHFLFIRILYPTFYFDTCEAIINQNRDESELIKIINNVDTYEYNIKNLYAYLKTIIPLPEIEWLQKM